MTSKSLPVVGNDTDPPCPNTASVTTTRATPIRNENAVSDESPPHCDTTTVPTGRGDDESVTGGSTTTTTGDFLVQARHNSRTGPDMVSLPYLWETRLCNVGEQITIVKKTISKEGEQVGDHHVDYGNSRDWPPPAVN